MMLLHMRLYEWWIINYVARSQNSSIHMGRLRKTTYVSKDNDNDNDKDNVSYIPYQTNIFSDNTMCLTL
jgi:hypothetical protein